MNMPPLDHKRLAYAHRTKACLLCAFSTAFSLAILILLLVFCPRPQQMRIAVTSASLSCFNLTSPSAGDRLLFFDLSTSLTFQNPSRRAGISYYMLKAQADFHGMWYAWTDLPVFYQGWKETTEVAAVLEGHSVIGKGVCGGRDNATGVFPVDLRIFGRASYMFGSVAIETDVFRALCPLRVPLGKAEFSFTDCQVSKNYYRD